MILVFAGDVKALSTEELKDIIAKHGNKMATLSSVEVQNEINIRERRNINV